MGRLGSQVLGLGHGLILGTLLLAAGATAQQPEPAVFTAEVSLVSLPVTVKDARGAPIGDLEREDFSILESGESREITVFERRTNRSLSVALMLDASLSTAIELRYEKESAGRFLERLLGQDSQPADAAAVFSFSSDTEVLAGFTHEHKELATALGRVRPETGTSVYDAILLASGELQKREGRRVIVMITDGGDTTSSLKFADALRAAHDAEVAIYPLIVLPIQSDAGRNRGGEHALITLADNTGGEAFVQYGARDLDAAFGEVLRNLRTQYLLGYYPRDDEFNPVDDFRKVQVRVAREGAVVLARNGYFAKSPVKRPVRRSRVGAPVRLRTVPQVGVDADKEPESAKPTTRPPRRSPGRKAPIVRPGP